MSLTDLAIDLEVSVKKKDATIVNQHKHINLLKEQNIDDEKAANLEVLFNAYFIDAY
jgi:hypothetical protein